MTQNDLFGHTPAQGSLFGDGDNRMQPSKRSDDPDPVVIRKRLNELLATARAAKTMPWNEHDAGVWQLIFPNMANVLPQEEARQLCFEFSLEMERLAKAA